MHQSFFLHYATIIIQHFGYLGLGLGLAICTLGLFSSEVFLLLAGLAVRQGAMDLWLALIVVVLGQLLGGLISYSIGRWGGIPLIERYGRYVLLSERDLERAHRWYKRYGRAATGIGYCLPFIRGYVGYAAGIAAENLALFVGSLLVGSLIWSAAAMALGYFLAAHVASVEAVFQPISYLLAVAVLAGIVYFVWHRLQERPS